MTLKQQLNGGATDWLVRAVIGAAMVWSLTELSAMRRDISSIQENRFTDGDGDSLARDLSDLRAKIETKADKSNVPPPDVLRDIQRLEDAVERLRGFHEQ